MKLKYDKRRLIIKAKEGKDYPAQIRFGRNVPNFMDVSATKCERFGQQILTFRPN